MCISNSNAFISSTKSVCLQRQKCSYPVQNVFVVSDQHVRLQCDSYLEVSSNAMQQSFGTRHYRKELFAGALPVPTTLVLDPQIGGLRHVMRILDLAKSGLPVQFCLSKVDQVSQKWTRAWATFSSQSWTRGPLLATKIGPGVHF